MKDLIVCSNLPNFSAIQVDNQNIITVIKKLKVASKLSQIKDNMLTRQLLRGNLSILKLRETIARTIEYIANNMTKQIIIHTLIASRLITLDK